MAHAWLHGSHSGSGSVFCAPRPRPYFVLVCVHARSAEGRSGTKQVVRARSTNVQALTPEEVKYRCVHSSQCSVYCTVYRTPRSATQSRTREDRRSEEDTRDTHGRTLEVCRARRERPRASACVTGVRTLLSDSGHRCHTLSHGDGRVGVSTLCFIYSI